MTGIMPLFAAAPRCKIRVGTREIAYAIGLSLNTTMAYDRIKVLGTYLPVAIEPLFMPPCTGTFRVVRLLSKTTRDTNATTVESTASLQNGFIGGTNLTYVVDGGNKTVDITSAITGDDTQVLDQAHLARHLDPARILFSQTFDLEIYLKVPALAEGDVSPADGILTPDAVTRLVGTIPTGGTEAGLIDIPFITIKDCRITGASADLTPGRLLTEPFSFQGLLAINFDGAGNRLQDLDVSWKDSPAG